MGKKQDSKELAIYIPRISVGSVPQTANALPLRKMYTFSYSFVISLNHFLCGNKDLLFGFICFYMSARIHCTHVIYSILFL